MARRLVVPSACPYRTACRRLAILGVEPVAAVCIACRASSSDLVYLKSDPAVLASLLYLRVVVVVASASAAAFPAPRAPHISLPRLVAPRQLPSPPSTADYASCRKPRTPRPSRTTPHHAPHTAHMHWLPTLWQSSCVWRAPRCATPPSSWLAAPSCAAPSAAL